MYDDFLLNGNATKEATSQTDLDNLFDNLTTDISNFNQFVNNIKEKQKENTKEEQELLEEKERISKAKADFEEYVKAKQEEYDKKISQVDEYANVQKQNLAKAQLEFKASMDSSLNELEISKKEIEMQKEKFEEEKKQFESYKQIEIDRIKHSKEILESDKNQFEKYKEVMNNKIELENKNLQQKCDRFKELLGQFNANFKPILDENKE